MHIDLSPEDLKTAEALVADGRFASIPEAIGAGLCSLVLEAQHVRWSPELQDSIHRGVAAASREEFASDAEMLSLFSRFQQKSA